MTTNFSMSWLQRDLISALEGLLAIKRREARRTDRENAEHILQLMEHQGRIFIEEMWQLLQWEPRALDAMAKQAEMAPRDFMAFLNRGGRFPSERFVKAVRELWV